MEKWLKPKRNKSISELLTSLLVYNIHKSKRLDNYSDLCPFSSNG